MKNQSLLVTLVLLLFLNSWSQEKSNPILFSEAYLGPAFGKASGFSIGMGLNYQLNANLLSVRYTAVTKNDTDWLFIFPVIKTLEQTDEFALLYGRRHIYGNHSFSYSSGISYVKNKELISEENDVYIYDTQQGVGLPFEVNIKWFNAKKERYRIYFLIPVGQPTSFSRSIGFKLYGNISKNSFIGLGVNYGFGWHKNY